MNLLRRQIQDACCSRSLIGLAALLVLLGQGAALVHVAGTRHEICASHGEVLEVDPGCKDLTPAGSDPHDEPADHHGHHECAVLQLWSQIAPTSSAPDSFASPDEPFRLERAPALETRAAALSTWRFAPKHSPPTA